MSLPYHIYHKSYFSNILCFVSIPGRGGGERVVQSIMIGYFTTNTVSLISFTNFNAQFLYSITICMLHYNPRHVSSINMHIFRRTNCIITASGIVSLEISERSYIEKIIEVSCVVETILK